MGFACPALGAAQVGMWASGQLPVVQLRRSDEAPVPPSTPLSPACSGEVSPQPAPVSGAERPARSPCVSCVRQWTH